MTYIIRGSSMLVSITKYYYFVTSISASNSSITIVTFVVSIAIIITSIRSSKRTAIRAISVMLRL